MKGMELTGLEGLENRRVMEGEKPKSFLVIALYHS